MSNNDYRPLSQDTAFDLLSNARRRLVLSYLQEEGGPISIGELATNVAAMENDVPPEELDAQQRKRTYVSLYQTHIPKLAKAGAVDYDSDEGTVSLAERATAVTSYLDAPKTVCVWPRYYLTVAAVGLPAYFISFLFDGINHIVIGSTILIVFAALSATHFWRTRRRATPHVGVEG